MNGSRVLDRLFQNCAIVLALTCSACSREVRVQRYPDGAVYLEQEWHRRALDGFHRAYFVDGKLASEGRYKDGLPDAAWRIFHPSGTKLVEETYERGLRNGPWREWYDDGTVRSEGAYAAGDKDGVWKTWDESGRLVAEETWEKGTRVGARFAEAK